jgi:hypothetical protein
MEGLIWRKASKSAVNGDCVEVGTTSAGRAAGIRDSKSPERGHLDVNPETFGAFLAGVKSGRLDLPLSAHNLGGHLRAPAFCCVWGLTTHDALRDRTADADALDSLSVAGRSRTL